MGVLSKQYFFSVTVLDDVFLTSFWVRLVTFGEAMNRFPKNSNDFQEPDQSLYQWLFQLDNSKPLRRKWLFEETSISNWLFGVAG